MKQIFLFLLPLLALTACNDGHADLPDGLYADLETSKGTITIALDFQKVPNTVANFVSLAEGKNQFVSTEYRGEPFFDNMKWHRVEPGFVIQSGDPVGNGAGDAGYQFGNEIVEGLTYDKPGMVGMANSGPHTNSSQFFITMSETHHLDGLHTIFGHVVGSGMDVVNKIERDDDLISVKIIRKGSAAKKFDASKVFADFFQHEEENLQKQAAQEEAERKAHEAQFASVRDGQTALMAAEKKTAKKLKSGVRIAVTKKANGAKPENGALLQLYYSGFLENGQLVDTNVMEAAQKFGTYNKMQAQYGKYRPITFEAGKRDGLIPGLIDGIEQLSYGDKALVFIPSALGYGPQGAGGVIPPNADLVFEIELIPPTK